MEEVIKNFKKLVNLSNSLKIQNIELTNELANKIVKYIENLENDNKQLEDEIFVLEYENECLTDENYDLLEMIEC